MQAISTIIYKMQSVFDIRIALPTLGIGLFIIFVDGKALKAKKLKKDARFAKVIGIIYTIVSPLLYIVLKLV